MSKRILVISDIHGCYDEFEELLKQVYYTPNNDKLILLGDYVNRGLKTKETIDKLLVLKEHDSVILKGNHDQWFINFLENPIKNYKAFTRKRVGGSATLKSYLNIDNLQECYAKDYADYVKANFNNHIKFLQNLTYFYEDNEHLYVHAGINPKIKNTTDILINDCLLIREPFLNTDHVFNKTIVFGHTTCSMLHNNPSIWFNNKKIGIDGGCCFNLQLNCLEILNNNYNFHFVKSLNYY